MNLRLSQRQTIVGARIEELRRRVRPVLEYVRGPGATFPWGDTWAFGLGIDEDEVTIYPGDICIGADVPVSSIESVRAITTDYQYVAVEYDWSADTLTVGSPTTTKPVSDDSVFRAWLYQFRYASGQASLYRLGSGGMNLLLPANYAK